MGKFSWMDCIKNENISEIVMVKKNIYKNFYRFNLMFINKRRKFVLLGISKREIINLRDAMH